MKKSEIALVIILVLSAFIVLSSRIGSTHFLVVLSGSMSPTINMGDLVIVSPTSPENIKVNDIIAFRNGDKKVPTTHRVINITSQGFITKGDANEDPDSRIVKPNEVIGKVVFNIPYTGYFVHYARSKYGFIFLVLIPGVVIIISEIKNILKYWKEGKSYSYKYIVLIPLVLLAFPYFATSSESYFFDTETSIGNTFTAWTPPILPGNVSISPTDDAFVRNITPKINYGSKRIIMVTDIKKGKAEIVNEGFLKFDLSELPDDAEITHAELRLYGLGISFNKNFNALRAENLLSRLFKSAEVSAHYVEDDSWDEGTITWKNKPSLGETLDTQSVNFPNQTRWDVTSKVKEEFQKDKIISFSLTTEEGLAIFFSKESNKRKPYLFVEFYSITPMVGSVEETSDPSLDEFLNQEVKKALNDFLRGSAGSGDPNSDEPQDQPVDNSTQNCTENWNCTEWSACVNGTQTRNCTDLNNCSTSFNKPEETRDCNVTNETCIEEWVCSDWSECINGTQTRNCTDLNACNSTLYKPIEFQECNSTELNFTCVDLCGDGICQENVCLADGCPCQETRESCPSDCSNSTDNIENCTEDWNCTEWSECINGTQTRVCVDLNACNTTFYKPNETQVCNSTQNVTECIENWNCSDWSECVNGTQTRTCVDLNECNTTLNKPPETQDCNVTTTTIPENVTTTTIPVNETTTTIPTNDTGG